MLLTLTRQYDPEVQAYDQLCYLLVRILNPEDETRSVPRMHGIGEDRCIVLIENNFPGDLHGTEINIQPTFKFLYDIHLSVGHSSIGCHGIIEVHQQDRLLAAGELCGDGLYEFFERGHAGKLKGFPAQHGKLVLCQILMKVDVFTH